jgi:hypothetical protein
MGIRGPQRKRSTVLRHFGDARVSVCRRRRDEIVDAQGELGARHGG